MLVGRLQIFNNWSPFLVADPAKVWIGLEYFCYEEDELWRTSGRGMIRLAIEEMRGIGMIDRRGCRGCDGDPHAENVSGVFRHLRSDSPKIREYVDGLRICFWSAATACTNTTTRTTRC